MGFSETFPLAHSVKCELATEVLASSGRLRLGAMGWSMLPSIWPGDTLFIEKVAGHPIAEGEIVLYGREGRFFIHRVVHRPDHSAIVVTQGDALSRPDPPVAVRDVLGKVAFIVRNGRLIQPARNLTMASDAIAKLARHSKLATRVIAEIHAIVNRPLLSNSTDRAVPCQN